MSETKDKEACQTKILRKAPSKNSAASIKLGVATVEKTAQVGVKAASDDANAANEASDKCTITPYQAPSAEMVGCHTDHQWENFSLFEDELIEPVARSLSREGEGDVDRATVGASILSVILPKKGNEIRYSAQMKDDYGSIKFHALLPGAEDAHMHMHVDIKKVNSLKWDAFDTYSGEGAMLREFSIAFDSGAQMFTFLV